MRSDVPADAARNYKTEKSSCLFLSQHFQSQTVSGEAHAVCSPIQTRRNLQISSCRPHRRAEQLLRSLLSASGWFYASGALLNGTSSVRPEMLRRSRTFPPLAIKTTGALHTQSFYRGLQTTWGFPPTTRQGLVLLRLRATTPLELTSFIVTTRRPPPSPLHPSDGWNTVTHHLSSRHVSFNVDAGFQTSQEDSAPTHTGNTSKVLHLHVIKWNTSTRVSVLSVDRNVSALFLRQLYHKS